MTWCELGAENAFSRCFITRHAIGRFSVAVSESVMSDETDLWGQMCSLVAEPVEHSRQDTPQCELGMVGQEAATAAAAACEYSELPYSACKVKSVRSLQPADTRLSVEWNLFDG